MLDRLIRTALEPVIEFLDRHGVQYYIGGSLASIAFGEPRATMDADFVAALDSGHDGMIERELGPDYYVDSSQIRDAIVRRSSFNLISLSTSFKIDVFVRRDRPYSASEFARRVRVKIGESPDLHAWFASAEDVLLNKLEWFRKGGEVSDRQWRDVLGILRVQGGSLDESYVRKWAFELGVLDLFERALVDGEPG